MHLQAAHRMSLHLICLYPILGVSHTEPLLYLRLPGWLKIKQKHNISTKFMYFLPLNTAISFLFFSYMKRFSQKTIPAPEVLTYIKKKVQVEKINPSNYQDLDFRNSCTVCGLSKTYLCDCEYSSGSLILYNVDSSCCTNTKIQPSLCEGIWMMWKQNYVPAGKY